jgi:acyl carrier protein
MPQLAPETAAEIRELVFDFFAEECAVERGTLSEQTDIIESLGGDSLMFLALLEQVRRRYGIGVELKTLAKHLMRKPASTIGQVVDLSIAVVERRGDLTDL